MFELIAAADRRLIGVNEPGVYIDVSRVRHVGVFRRDWFLVPEPDTWMVQVITTDTTIHADDRTSTTWSGQSFECAYPSEAAARNMAAKIERWVAFGLTGVEAIAAERRRQITDEEWTAEYDDQHREGELIAAAFAYLDVAYTTIHLGVPDGTPGRPPKIWPWGDRRFRPTWDDPTRMLVKAGALIAAEIDRLARVASVADETTMESESTANGDDR